MKRAALPFLVLVGAVLLFVAFRKGAQGDAESPRGGDPEMAIEHDSSSEASSNGVRPRVTSGAPAAANSERENAAPENAAPENAAPENAAPENAGALLADEGSGANGAGVTALPGERAPAKRYQDGDALAMRRARQIELVTRAQEQAREALNEAEEGGETDRATRTRAILRRLQIRLDALEAAASALEPY